MLVLVNRRAYRFFIQALILQTSQGDLAHLHAEDIDWSAKTICFERMKLRGRGLKPPLIYFGPSAEIILARLPKSGPLFPYMIGFRSADRATEFKQRCEGLKIKGVSLHSYRYAWAERAEQWAYPERYVQSAHADLRNSPEFQESIVQKWRGEGNARVPDDWD